MWYAAHFAFVFIDPPGSLGERSAADLTGNLQLLIQRGLPIS
jgi:hypothetical protein